MTGLWKSFAGMVRVRITSGSLPITLSRINDRGVVLLDLKYIDELTAEATVYRSDCSFLQDYLSSRGQSIKVVEKAGVFWAFQKLLHRPVLVLGVIIYLAFALYLPTRVLFVHVDGNSLVPTNLILEKADKCGIGFGVSRREVRNERIKNALLGEIPELQWVGVNTYGCVAVISVKERSVTKQEEQIVGVSNIVASRDGVVTELFCTKGAVKCRVGQAVKAGQILVSGYTDCGIFIKASRAQGEIFATTLHEVALKTPMQCAARSNKTSEKTKYSLQIGKKLIKLSQDSGISPSTCVKMYETKYMELPGGFRLPVALICERFIIHEQKAVDTSEEDAQKWLKHFSRAYLQSQMIAGYIIDYSEVLVSEDDSYCLYGRYFCHEMIGQERNEEIIQNNG